MLIRRVVHDVVDDDPKAGLVGSLDQGLGVFQRAEKRDRHHNGLRCRIPSPRIGLL